MTNNLNALATALYVTIDDLLTESPHLTPWRPIWHNDKTGAPIARSLTAYDH